MLSLCGGVETGILALQRLGIPIAEYHTYEILPEAIAISTHHFPWVIHHGDVFAADWNEYKGFDLVIGGMCCQSISRVRIENKEVNNGLLGKSERCSLMGNAWNEPTVEHIFKGIKMSESEEKQNE